MANKWESNEEIQIFQEYLRIPSVHPNIDYESCVDFIRKQAESLGLPMKVYYPAKKTKPIAIITYIGTEPELESIYFNSHMDVVPVYEELWTHPPFGAEIDDEGLIFARGAQDMKSLGTQYLGALRYFIKNNIRFKRTIHVGFVPDEEIGGHDGMAAFVHTDDFRNLNIGCGFDEGCPSENDTFFLFYGEKITWQLKFTCEGTPGHGCFVVDNTAGEKAAYIINKMMNYRAEQLNSLNDKPDFSRSDITTLNLTVMKGGVQSNVVPPSFEFCFDVRISINTDHIALEEQIRTWMTEAGEGVSLEFLVKAPFVRPVPLDDKNIYWGAIKNCFAENGIKCKAGVIPGATDIQQLRALGIPAFGFSPLKNTKLFIHEHDEHLHADVYLHGIEVYKKLIPAIANC